MPAEKSPTWVRHEELLLVVPSVAGYGDGAGALSFIVSRVAAGYVRSLEKILFVSTAVGAGAGATQTYKVRKGSASGAVVGTLTLALADVDVSIGKSKAAAAVTDGTERFLDTDTLSFTRDAGGTAFTTLAGYFLLVWRQKPQGRN